MQPQRSLTYWIGELKVGDRNAASQHLWEECSSRLIRVARARLAALPRLRNDAEDVALHAFDSFIRRAEAGNFPRLDNRNNLWALLITITCRKASRLASRQNAPENRLLLFTDLELDNDGNRQRIEPYLEAVAKDPDPAEAAAVSDTVAQLLDVLGANLKEVALLKLDGYTNKEIGDRIGCCEGSVGRKLSHIRDIWRAEFPDLVPPA